MASDDQQLAIIIRAVDEVSATMKNIEKKLDASNANIQKQTEETSKTFDKQMGSVLVLGQAVQNVDNIMSSYQNLQIRLENATERLANAQDRLTKSQLNLKKVQKDTSASAEDLAAAEQEVTAASRGLTIAQNNLERTNNQVFGTYVQMGLGVTQLIASMPILINSVRMLTVASMAFIATPIGLAIVAIAAAVAVATVAITQHNREMKALVDAQTKAADSTKDAENAFYELNDEVKRTSDAITIVDEKLKGLFSGPKSEKELQALVDIAEKEKEIADLKVARDDKGRRPQGTSARLEAAEMELEKLKLNYDAEFKATQDVEKAKLELWTAQGNAQNEIQKQVNDFANMSYVEQLAFLETTFYKEVDRMRQADVAADEEAWRKKAEAAIEYNRIVAEKETKMRKDSVLKVAGLKGPIDTGPSLADAIGGWFKSKTTKVNDAIIRPNGQVIETHPNDTIMAFKKMTGLDSGGGVIVEINGPIYGVSPEQISRALAKEFYRKVSY